MRRKLKTLQSTSIIKISLLLLLIVCLSFGQSIFFDLWQDDNALIFKLQHPDEAAGVFGPGLFGIGAYRYIAVPYLPIYKLFGANISIFYLWAIFFYFLATLAVFFLARGFTRSNLFSGLAAAVFAAGFVGSDGILRLFNSIQTSYSVAFVCFMFVFLHRAASTRRFSAYFLALFFFFLAVQTAYIRTLYLILPTIVFFFLFFRGFAKLAFIPFALLYYLVFLSSPDPRAQAIENFLKGVLSGQPAFTYGFFGTVGATIVPDPVVQFLFSLTAKVSLDYTNQLILLNLVFLTVFALFVNLLLNKTRVCLRLVFFLLQLVWTVFVWIFFYNSELLPIRSPAETALLHFVSFIGGLFLILVAAVVIVVLGRSRKLGLFAIFAFLWFVFNILAYSIYLPFSPLESINRYLVHSLAAYGLFFALLGTTFAGKHKYKMIVPITGIILVNIALSAVYQHRFVVEKAVPTKRFYEQLKIFVPQIPKGAVLYFDVDQSSTDQFLDFFSVGSMPDTTAIAVRYGIDRYDLGMTKNFAEFVSLLSAQNTPPDLTFSFFYNKDGLIDTTNTTRQHLFHAGSSLGRFPIPDTIKLSAGSPEATITGLNIPSVTPVLVTLTAKTDVSLRSQLNVRCDYSLSPQERKVIFDYILSKGNFLKDAKITTSSSQKYQGPDFLKDAKPETIWRGNRGWWHEKEVETIMIDLGRIQPIAQLVWINGYSNSTPTAYTIKGSIDNIHWDVLKQVTMGGRKENGAVVIENFPQASVQYIEFIIDSTYDNDSPAIAQIEVVESQFAALDRRTAQKIESTPAHCVTTEEDMDVVTRFLKAKGIALSLAWTTDKQGWSADTVKTFVVQPDGVERVYQVIIPAGGTVMKNLKVGPALAPSTILISGVEFTHPTLDYLTRNEIK